MMNKRTVYIGVDVPKEFLDAVRLIQHSSGRSCAAIRKPRGSPGFLCTPA